MDLSELNMRVRVQKDQALRHVLEPEVASEICWSGGELGTVMGKAAGSEGHDAYWVEMDDGTRRVVSSWDFCVS